MTHERIIKAGINSATTKEGRSRIESIEICLAGYAEPESLGRMAADCQAFLDLVATELPFVLSETDSSDLGHDFWLTRAGHGTGFWDGDYDWLDRDGIDVGDKLTDLSKMFSARSLYLGDDGKVYEASA